MSVSAPVSTSRSVSLRPLMVSDATVVLDIYQEGIEGGNATFTAAAPSWEDWDKGHIPSCRFVAELDGVVVGWAALSAVSSRCVYQGVAEVSIYVTQTASGCGIGSKLMDQLVKSSEEAGFWMLQSSIFPENAASITLHEKFGFRVVGRREKIARMSLGALAGQWRDVMFMERRSSVVGLD